jgi:transposase
VFSAEHDDAEALRSKLAELEATLAATAVRLAKVTAERDKVVAERDNFRRAYDVLREHHELLRRKLFAAKAERIDVTQLELEFAETKKKLAVLAMQIAADVADDGTGAGAPPPDRKKSKKKATPKGRPDLRAQDLPEERIELTDAALENDVLEGRAARIGFEESCRFAYRRGTFVRLVVARATYKTETSSGVEAAGNSASVRLVTVETPKELVQRGLYAPSLIAHLLVSKYRFGIPFHRLAEMFRAQGVRIDDGTMCRYAEHVGASLGCIVDAMAREAKETAFCLSTDATGVSIQPGLLLGGPRRACRKGHFFVVLADQDHVFFEYQAEHTSKAVCQILRGFQGYVQADAHAVYNALFRGEALVDDRGKPLEDASPPDEVGCWAHARRRWWEAATAAKDVDSREALLRVRALFKLEEEWADLPPLQRQQRRQLIARPLVDDFFAWAEAVFTRIKARRGLATAAFGYAVRQAEALRRFLDDGRLALTNNHSERALRFICAGRKSWLFFGSDDHASAAANLFSLVASCKLHDIDAETYLAEMIRIVPLWPRDRYLELAPKHWTATRARLDDAELAREIGTITVPPNAPSEEQADPR